MEETAQSYIKLLNNENINYYDYYKNKYCINNIRIDDDLKDRLINLRKNRSNKMNIPAFFIFTNKELNKILKIRPETIDELKNANILSDVKIKTHGEAIINEINKH